VLYKYLSRKRLSVIDNFRIRFTQPGELNDPFESAMLVDPDGKNELSKIIADLERDALLNEIIPENSEQKEFLDEKIRELANYVADLYAPHTLGKELAKKLNSSLGVLSLSRTNASLLMWAHYGDSHKGYVVGLDDSHAFFNQIDNFGKITKPYNVVYTSRRNIVKPGSEDYYEKMMCRKSLEWAYEEEVRIFRGFSNSKIAGHENADDRVYLEELPRECIKEIYIGANASEDTKRKILEIVDKRKLHVKIFQARVSDELYALEFTEIQPQYSFRCYDIYHRKDSFYEAEAPHVMWEIGRFSQSAVYPK